MTTVSLKLPYTVEKGGNLFWQPTPTMQEKGFQAMPLGPVGPASIAKAKKLYEDWLKAKTAAPKVTGYPPGTLGAFWDRYTGRYTGKPVMKWKKLATRSREDYHRAWAYIDTWKPDESRQTLSRTVLTKISTEDCEAFFQHMEDNYSPSERYRTIKCLKALLSDAMVRLKLDTPSPAANLTNPQAKGRSQIWLGSEIEHLIETAIAEGYIGMALAIMIAWDTLFSPVDVWTAARRQFKRDRSGPYVHRERTKTEKEAFGNLSTRTAEALALYVAALPFALGPDAPVIRQRNGHAYRSKDTFGDDFRSVRQAAFPAMGEDGKFIEQRKFLDIRRSGNVEADAAGADKATMGEILANGLANNKFLDDTYTPPTVAKAREVATQRLAGRKLLAAELDRVSHSNSGPLALVQQG